MIIFWLVAESLSSYVKLTESSKAETAERPRRCHTCGGQDCFWAHGSYRRTVEEDGRSDKLEIARFKCSVCGRTTSVLPWFVIPRRRYTVKTVADGIERYATKPETYKEGATKLGPEGPSPAQLFRWVALLVERVTELLVDVQAWCVSDAVEEVELLTCEAAECPNACKAQIPEKGHLLGDLAKLVSYGRSFFKGARENVVQGLGMKFLHDVEQMQQIFAHRNLWKPTPQRMKP
jgi:hypothetical protein